MRSGSSNALVAVALLGALAACNPEVDNNRSAVIPVIVSINDGGALDSDVITDEGTIFEDEVDVDIQSIPKAPLAGEVSDLYTVRFTQAVITFVRPDGLSEPGIDVPFPMTQNINVVVEPDDTVTFSLTVVTHLMKLEPPLRTLQFLGGELEIATTAFIQLSGADLSGNGVTAEGTFPVFFADFAG